MKCEKIFLRFNYDSKTPVTYVVVDGDGDGHGSGAVLPEMLKHGGVRRLEKNKKWFFYSLTTVYT